MRVVVRMVVKRMVVRICGGEDGDEGCRENSDKIE